MHTMACGYVGDCTCVLNAIWSNENVVTIYPHSKLVVCNGLIFKYQLPTRMIFGMHRLEDRPRILLLAPPSAPAPRAFGASAPAPRAFGRAARLYLSITSDHIVLDDGDVSNAFHGVLDTTHAQNMMQVEGVGLARVRRLQRWFRFILGAKKRLALMMSNHKRLGASSCLQCLSMELLQMCLP